MDWVWVAKSVVYAIHERQLAEHGGLEGVRDVNLVDTAIIRPQNKAHYGSGGAHDLAAAYAFGLVRNHGFNDGNKRTAWVVAKLFLALNGFQLNAKRIESVLTMTELAAGNLEESEFASWLLAHCTAT